MKLLLIMLSCALLAYGAGDLPMRTTVCEALANLEQWNGRLVEIRAQMGDGGLWLADPDCDHEVSVTSRTGHKVVFSNLINLVLPSQPRLRVHKQVDFRFDQTAWDAFYHDMNSAYYRRERMRVTVIGLFETHIPLNLLAVSGFGAEGAAPAQIVIKTVKDWVPEPGGPEPIRVPIQ